MSSRSRMSHSALYGSTPIPTLGCAAAPVDQLTRGEQTGACFSHPRIADYKCHCPRLATFISSLLAELPNDVRQSTRPINPSLISFTDPASGLLRDQEADARESSSLRVPASNSLPFKKRRAIRNKAIAMDEEQRRVVYRYLLARVGLRKAELPPLSDLEYQMKHGFDRLSGGVVVNRIATQPITADDQDPAFYAAVLNGHAEAINITSLSLE